MSMAHARDLAVGIGAVRIGDHPHATVHLGVNDVAAGCDELTR